MCFGGGGGGGGGGEQQVIYVPMSQEQMVFDTIGIPYQQQQYQPYQELGGMSPQGQTPQGASNILGSKPQGGDFSSSGNLGTTSMLPGASQLLRKQSSPQYTWA